ncbi:MAG: hypothetical protein IT534_14680 [Bauldia sp.]|nr:hypothetical protein [Bauldia sp.]
MPALAQPALTDAQIRQMMIDRSIADYLRNHGNCPCPYNIRRDGKRRDDWSAWSRPGGESPLCYPDDIPAAAVITFRATL